MAEAKIGYLWTQQIMYLIMNISQLCRTKLPTNVFLSNKVMLFQITAPTGKSCIRWKILKQEVLLLPFLLEHRLTRQEEQNIVVWMTLKSLSFMSTMEQHTTRTYPNLFHHDLIQTFSFIGFMLHRAHLLSCLLHTWW